MKFCFMCDLSTDKQLESENYLIFFLILQNRAAEAETFLNKALEIDATNHNIYQHYGKYFTVSFRHFVSLMVCSYICSFVGCI